MLKKLFIFLFISGAFVNLSNGQSFSDMIKAQERLFSVKNVLNFPDSVHLFLRYDDLPKDTGYFMLRKVKGKRFQVTYWMGHEGFVDPEWYKDLLRVHIKRKNILFKYKKRTVTYELHQKNGINGYLLVRVIN